MLTQKPGAAEHQAVAPKSNLDPSEGEVIYRTAACSLAWLPEGQEYVSPERFLSVPIGLPVYISTCSQIE